MLVCITLLFDGIIRSTICMVLVEIRMMASYVLYGMAFNDGLRTANANTMNSKHVVNSSSKSDSYVLVCWLSHNIVA